MEQPLTVIIPFFNGHQHIDKLLGSITRANLGLPIIVVDDHSDTPLHLNRKIFSGVQVLRPKEKGYFAGAVNAGIQAAGIFAPTGDVLVLNQDTWFDDGALANLIQVWQEQPANLAIMGDGVHGHPAWPKGYVQGTLMFLRRAAIEKVGLLNQTDYPLWGCTAEWQLRAARKHWKADPWRHIEGFHHARPKGEDFGSSIKQTLQRQPKKDVTKLIRTPPAISVIIPTYNHGKFLADAVLSLIGGQTSYGLHPGQTFQSFEVIIVDDGSTDFTEEVGRALADDWTGVRYIRKPNGGTPSANNAGIRAAYGKYVTILCADDLREPGSLERLYRAAEANPHSIVYDDVILKTNSGREKIWTLPEYDFEALLNKNFMHAGILFPRTAWEEIGGYPEQMKYGREDWAVNVALGIKGYCGVRVPVPGYIYRRHDNNRTLNNTNPFWRDRFANQMRDLFPEIYQGVRPMACCGKPDHPVGDNLMKTNNALVGADGMTAVTYEGGNYGNEAYYGPVTGQRYLFSKKNATRLVDDRDLRTPNGRGLLQINENGRLLFRRANPLPQPPPEQPPVELAQDFVPAPTPDDLTKINGVGASTAEKLASLGFTTYKAVAGMNAEAMAVVTGIQQARLQKIIDGAQVLADG